MNKGSFQPDWFSRPGDTIVALMARRQMTFDVLADQLGMDTAQTRGLLAGAVAIDQAIAKRLSETIGGTVSFWINRQSAYVEALSLAAERIPKEQASEWLRRFPHRDLSEFGWVEKQTSCVDTLKCYLAYFGVSSPEEWESRYAEFLADVNFRTSPTFVSKVGALSAWLRQGEMQATQIQTTDWNRSFLRERLGDLRKLSMRKSPFGFAPKLREICASAGIAVVFVRGPKGCRASGATRFLSPRKAMLILSFRHLSDDHFWFTFFHEIGHLVLHSQTTTFVDSDPTSDDDREAEANAFAAGVLVPVERQEELAALPPRMNSVVRFAVSVGVSPGVIVGQMQHLRTIGPNQLNFLKRRYSWEEIAAAFG